jgi:hypothetical protein
VLNDEDGNNLIENGTYKREDIKVTSNGNLRGEVSSDPEFDTLILIVFSGGAGDVNYEIVLNESETDMLRLNLSILEERGFCRPSDYEVNTALYKGEIQEIIRNNGEYTSEKIILIK